MSEALKNFGIDIVGKTAIDIGASTGGFVDCLLQAGASRVYAIDAGTHQLHEKLRKDPRVVVRENVNARYLTLEDIGERADIITVDVSFISLKKIIPAALPLLAPGGFLVTLVKPQFEVGRYQVGKGGIVKDEERIKAVIDDIRQFGAADAACGSAASRRRRGRKRERTGSTSFYGKGEASPSGAIFCEHYLRRFGYTFSRGGRAGAVDRPHSGKDRTSSPFPNRTTTALKWAKG